MVVRVWEHQLGRDSTGVEKIVATLGKATQAHWANPHDDSGRQSNETMKIAHPHAPTQTSTLRGSSRKSR
jgi:hypothetical protein